MKHAFLILLTSVAISRSMAQNPSSKKLRKNIYELVDAYSRARETRDTVLLKRILMEDVDQLVSNGEWRVGIRSAVQGMMASSTANPGSRTLAIEKIKMLGNDGAVVDCRYEIANPDGSVRKMWSTFIVVTSRSGWKIAAIRNMLPARG